MVALCALTPSVPPRPGLPVELLNSARALFRAPPPSLFHGHASALFRCTLIGQVSVIKSLWLNPRHGRRPRYQVTALAKRGTNVVALMNTEYKIQFLVVNPHGNIILGFSKGI